MEGVINTKESKKGSIKVVNIERRSYTLVFWYKRYCTSVKKKCNTGYECNKESKTNNEFHYNVN